jgi:hypothetical protein
MEKFPPWPSHQGNFRMVVEMKSSKSDGEGQEEFEK